MLVCFWCFFYSIPICIWIKINLFQQHTHTRGVANLSVAVETLALKKS